MLACRFELQNVFLSVSLAALTQPPAFFCHQLAKASEPEKLHAEFKRKAMASSGAKSSTTQKGSSLADIVPSMSDACLFLDFIM